VKVGRSKDVGRKEEKLITITKHSLPTRSSYSHDMRLKDGIDTILPAVRSMSPDPSSSLSPS